MPQHENLAAALAAFQADLPKLTKDQSAKVQGQTDGGAKFNYTYGYAGLDQVTGEVSPALGKHGLSFTAFPTVLDNGAFGLKYALLHESGESREGVWPLPDPTRIKPQQLGSAITYGRRYAFMAVTNTFPGGEDDDGAAAVPTAHRDRAMSPEEFQNLPRERPQSAPTSPAAPQAKTWTDAEVLEQHAKIDTLELEKAGALYDWMAARDLHKRKVGVDDAKVDATFRIAHRIAVVAIDDATTVENLSWLRDFADRRGLLKAQVSPQSNLDEWLTRQRDSLVRAVVDSSGNAQAMKQAAADSWDEKPPQPTVYTGADADAAPETGADLRIDTSDPANLP